MLSPDTLFSAKTLLFTASSLILATILLAAHPARAEQPQLDEKYLTIDHAEFEELSDKMAAPTPAPAPAPRLPALGGDEIGTAINEINAIINIGKELWQVVEANQPVVSTTQNSATAVPEGIHHWSELEGWQNPETRSYQLALKNGYGSTVVNFTYQLQFNAGGSQGGHGQYLANATIRATHVEVLWGYHFSADATVGDVLNVGTHQDPIAGVNLTLTWKVGTVLKQDNGSRTFFVRGDGQIDDLSQ